MVAQPDIADTPYALPSDGRIETDALALVERADRLRAAGRLSPAILRAHYLARRHELVAESNFLEGSTLRRIELIPRHGTRFSPDHPSPPTIRSQSLEHADVLSPELPP